MDAESAKAIEVAACDGPVIYFIISRNFGLLKNFILRFLQQQVISWKWCIPILFHKHYFVKCMRNLNNFFIVLAGPVTFHRILNPILMEEDSDPNPEDHPVDVVSPDPSIEGNPSRVGSEGAGDPKNIFPITAGRLNSALKSVMKKANQSISRNFFFEGDFCYSIWRDFFLTQKFSYF